MVQSESSVCLTVEVAGACQSGATRQMERQGKEAMEFIQSTTGGLPTHPLPANFADVGVNNARKLS
jgi:hypothetical protein